MDMRLIDRLRYPLHGTIVLIFIGVAWSLWSGHASPPVPRAIVRIPAAPTAVLAPAIPHLSPHSNAVPLPELDVDVELPPDATAFAVPALDGYVANLNWRGCYVIVTDSAGLNLSGPTRLQQIGNRSIWCIGRAWSPNAVIAATPPDPRCVAVCDTIKPMPGTELQSFPAERSRLELSRSGGFGGGSSKLVVWSDGTVKFTGRRCEISRRGQLPPARVEVLIAAIEQMGWFSYEPGPRTTCVDDVARRLVVRSRGEEHVDEIQDCASRELTREVVDAIEQVVGPNPCADGSE